MKKIINSVIISLAIVFVLAGTSACSMTDTKTEVTDETEELETTLKDDLDSWETEAMEDIDKSDTISRDKISEAVDYIDEHIDDPFEDEDVTHKLYYYSSYIIALVDKKGINIDHDIYRLAVNTRDYIRSIHTEEATEDDDTMTGLRDDLDDIKGNIENAKDDLVDEFYDLVK